MPLTAAQLSTDFTAMLSDLPSVVIYKSETVTGTISGASGDPVLEMRGILHDIKKSVWVKVADLTNLPTDNQPVTIDGTVYQILNTHEDGAGVVIRLDVGNLNA